MKETYENLNLEDLRRILLDKFRYAFGDEPKSEIEFDEFELKIWNSKSLLIEEINKLEDLHDVTPFQVG